MNYETVPRDLKEETQKSLGRRGFKNHVRPL